MPEESNKAIKALRANLDSLKKELEEKLELQHNIPTYTDKLIYHAIRDLEAKEEYDGEVDFGNLNQQAMQALLAFSRYHIGGRFQILANRHLNLTKNQRFPQGVVSSLEWKNMPLIKTVEDFAIIPLLIQKIKPQTIFEIGSGIGASAIWLADQLKINEIDGKVYSFDKCKPNIAYETVDFIEGDATQIENLLDKYRVQLFPHPWLIVDDDHTTIVPVLEYLSPLMQIGDYVFVEDSSEQKKEIGAFMMRNDNSFLVDTYYTDFFGINTVSAKNSIFKKVK